MKVGIFGGTFNPIHNGHLRLMEEMTRALSLDEIILIPTATPPHKDDSAVIDGRHRLEMCRLATAYFPKATVSDLELQRGGKSFTLDTLRLLAIERPTDEFVLLMGSDMFYSLLTWHKAEELLRMVEIAVVAREEDEWDKLYAQQNILTEKGAKTRVVRAAPLVASSTAVREGEGSDTIPELVENYLTQNGLYGRTIDFPVDLDELTAELRAKLSPKRFVHTLNVASEALRLAHTYEQNEEVAYLAGLLHDACKEWMPDEVLKILSESARIKEPVFLASPRAWHGFAAAEYARQHWGILNAEILDAVAYHTTGRGEMGRIEEILYMADLISADRGYPGVEALRRKTYQSLEEGLLEAMQFILCQLVRQEQPIFPETLAAYHCYLSWKKQQSTASEDVAAAKEKSL